MYCEIDDFLKGRIAAGDFPSAVFLAAEKGEIAIHGALGNAVEEPEHIAARTDTIYDMASITKVLVTGLLTAQLVEQGELAEEDHVSDLLPEFQAEDKRQITVKQLLTHTSRLEAWKPLYACVSDPADVVSEIDSTPLIADDLGVTYSDLNFILLGKIIERITDQDLDDAALQNIFQPLGLKDTSYNPFAILKQRIAASEKGNAYERQTCVEMGYLSSDTKQDTIRTEVIWGEVHDGNARFMGGVAGHAGLFSTAEETLKIAMQFLPEHTQLLAHETCDLFRTNFTPCPDEHRSFGFQLASTPESTAGSRMSPQSFGHLGFTGTSLWIDPVAERVFILLTNRTHNHGLPFVNTNSVRRQFNDLAYDLMDKNH